MLFLHLPLETGSITDMMNSSKVDTLEICNDDATLHVKVVCELVKCGTNCLHL